VSLLLDTHVILWWLQDDPRLPDELKTRLDEDLDIFVSAVSIWEVTVKQSVGKLPDRADLVPAIRASFEHLPIGFDHAIRAGRLPLVHRDPFDRMLVAQAQCERLTLVSHDAVMQEYEVELLLV
jgi:PIN domain nuclease of toxin-antitoxin system